MDYLETYNDSNIVDKLYKLRDYCNFKSVFVIYNNLFFLLLFFSGLLSLYKLLINGLNTLWLVMTCFLIMIVLIVLIYLTYVLSMNKGKIVYSLNKMLKKSKNQYILSDYGYLDENTNMLYWTREGIDFTIKRLNTMDGLTEDLYILILKEFDFMQPLSVIISESYYYKLNEFLKETYNYNRIISLSKDLVKKNSVVNIVGMEQQYLKFFASKEIG